MKKAQVARGLIREAEIVVVGGGCIGTGVAYSLAKAGKKDIVLLEKEYSICLETSAKAAGLVGQVRASVDRARLAKWSVDVFSDLQKNGVENNSQTPSWRQVGSIRIAETKERIEEFKILQESCKQAGVPVEIISKQDCLSKWPGMNLDQAKAILWCPTDGYLQPSDLAMTYASKCKDMGVTILTNHSCQGIITSNGRVDGIKTNHGDIKCKYIINAAGAHAYHVAKLAGLSLPIFPVRHEFFITSQTSDVKPTFPTLRIVDSGLYGRPDVNSILLGGWERNSLSLDPKSYDMGENPPAIEEDWPILAKFGELGSKFLPNLKNIGIRQVYAGWPTFVPDGRFLVGETRVKGFVMAAGCNAHGVSGSAGIGAHVVESIFSSTPSEYVKSLSPKRFVDIGESDWKEAQKRAQKVYETYYDISK